MPSKHNQAAAAMPQAATAQAANSAVQPLQPLSHLAYLGEIQRLTRRRLVGVSRFQKVGLTRPDATPAFSQHIT